MNTSYAAENAVERERLFRVTAKLSEEELTHQMADGWSVAAKLVHLAFWDRYYLSLIQGWERNGFTPTTANADAINETILVLSRAIAPEAVVQLVLDAAEA